MNERQHGHEGSLDPRARAALAAFRAEDDMPRAAQARVWERLEAVVEAPVGAAVRPIGAARRRRSLGATTAVVLAAAAALLLLASRSQVVDRLADAGRADAAGYASGEQAEAAAVPKQPEPRAQPASAAAEPAPVVEAPAPADAAAVTSEHVREDMARETRKTEPARGRGEAGRAAAGPTGPSLSQEAELLAQAQAALRGERPTEALALLGEYSKRFPQGALREEQSALRAIALCAAGREREGRGAAQAFLREHSGSALEGRVRGACLGE